MRTLPEVIKIPELNIEVQYVDEFNEEAGEILTSFCEELQKKGMFRPITEDEEGYEDCIFVWTHKAADLIETELQRLYEIGRKYFGNTIELDIQSYMYQER